MYRIYQANISDIDRILKVYDIAREYMHEKNNFQWEDGYPSYDDVYRDITSKNLYKICMVDKIVGVFYFSTEPDDDYSYIEGKWRKAKKYGVIHRVASSREYRDIFKACFMYCRDRIDYLRIDTHADNEKMNTLIKKNGFKKCGIVYVRNNSPRIAYDYVK